MLLVDEYGVGKTICQWFAGAAESCLLPYHEWDLNNSLTQVASRWIHGLHLSQNYWNHLNEEHTQIDLRANLMALLP